MSSCALTVDSAARRHLISNTLHLLGVLRGRNVLLSSGARRAIELRGAYDICNLCGYA